MRAATILAFTAMTLGLLGFVSAAPASAVDGVIDESFDSASSWSVATGTGSLSAATGSTPGSEAMKIDYSVGPNLEVGYAAGRAAASLGANPLSGLKIDYKGDGTYNTLYLRLIDATGERFYYRVGNLNIVGWTTATVDLRTAPLIAPSDNGVLDGPVSLFRLVVARNGTQPPTGSVTVDNLRGVTDGWTRPVAAAPTFVPDGSNELEFSFTAGTAGDFSLLLTDSAGRSRRISETALAPGAQVVSWDGRSDSSDFLSGIISSVFSYDTSADRTITPPKVNSGQPHVVSLSAAEADEVRVHDFEDSPSNWTPALGSITPSASTDWVEGSHALLLKYDLASSTTAEIGRTRTPSELPSLAFESMKLSYRGDGTQNTLYVRLKDASGEDFLYRVGLLQSTAWTTAIVNLQNPEVTQFGDADGILTAPVTVYRIMIALNPGHPKTGSVAVDDLRLTHAPWGGLEATSTINRESGGSSEVSFTSEANGDYALSLSDSDGRNVKLTGVTHPGSISVRWTGKSSEGVYLQGVVSAVLRVDSVADGSVDASAASLKLPYLMAIPARARVLASPSSVGVNSFMTTASSTQSADADAELMERAHVAYTREEFNWALLERRQGYFDWVKTDRAVAVAEARNIEVVGKLFYTASWATSAPAGTPQSEARYYPPADMSDFAAFAKATVERYSPTVKSWEIWNEPNLLYYWRSGVNPTEYAAMLQATYTAIKEADPSARVMIGGTVGFDESFMKGIVDAGALESFDDLAIHTYVDGAPEGGYLDTWLGGARSWIDRTKPSANLWVTEAGWSTCSCSGAVTEAVQADYLSRLYLKAAQYGVRGLLWFSLREVGESTGRDDNYGLVTTSGALKPGYEALRQTGSALDAMAYGGLLAPTSGTSSLVDDLAVLSGTSTYGYASATGTVTSSSTRLGGTGSLQVKYALPKPTSFFEIKMSKGVSGTPRAISVWAYGDKTNNSISMKLRDTNGETFQVKVGHLFEQDWNRYTFYLDSGNPGLITSGGDGVVDYPITLTSLIIARSPGSIGGGQILLDDLTAHDGEITRGAMFIGRNFNLQAVYSIPSTQVTIPVARNPSYSQVGESYTLLSPAGDRSAILTAGARVRFAVSTANASHDPQTSRATANWVGGDRERSNVQIIDASGTVVRTLAVNQAFVSGRQSMSWDLKKADGTTAPRGSYAFVITLTGPDKRTTWVGRSFLIP